MKPGRTPSPIDSAATTSNVLVWITTLGTVDGKSETRDLRHHAQARVLNAVLPRRLSASPQVSADRAEEVSRGVRAFIRVRLWGASGGWPIGTGRTQSCCRRTSPVTATRSRSCSTATTVSCTGSRSITSRNPDDAADALQDAMLRRTAHASGFRHDASVSSWLYRIVVNACLDRLRRNKTRPTAVLEDDAVPVSDPTPRVDTALVVERALMRLPVEQRAAVVAVDMQGYSVAETARLLGVPEGTVKSRCSRARVKLAESLEYLGHGAAAARSATVDRGEPGQEGQRVDGDRTTLACPSRRVSSPICRPACSTTTRPPALRRQAREDPAAARTVAALDRVRRDLAELGRDAASAPAVPADVAAALDTAVAAASTNRVTTSADTAPSHAARLTPRRLRLVVAAIGATAAVMAVGVGTLMLVRAPAPASSSAPTAETISVDPSPGAIPLSDDEILAAADPSRRLASLERSATPGVVSERSRLPVDGDRRRCPPARGQRPARRPSGAQRHGAARGRRHWSSARTAVPSTPVC